MEAGDVARTGGGVEASFDSVGDVAPGPRLHCFVMHVEKNEVAPKICKIRSSVMSLCRNMTKDN